MGPFVEHCPAATMGGLIASKLGRIPQVGDVVQFSNLQLEVLTMEEYRVATVLVFLTEEGAV